MRQEDLNKISEIHTDVKWIKQAVFGNGQRGLVAKVESNSRFRWIATGALGILSALLTYGFITISSIK